MQATEIVAISRKAITELLAGRDPRFAGGGGKGRRRTTRWPFPGTVELWVPEGDGTEHHALATSLNLAVEGVGLLAEEELTCGTAIDIAIHEPEASLHGRGIVRHCTPVEAGYYVGVQFIFA